MLSPLNFSGLVARARGEVPAKSQQKPRRGAVEVIRWACPQCGEEYEEYEEDEAEACCQGEEPGATNCPVCGESAETHRAATDCCLWKDLDAPTRHAIADRVEAGSTWVAELAPYLRT